MKINFIPKSFLGGCSLALIIVMPILFYAGTASVDFYLSVPAGETISRDMIMRPGVAWPMSTGFVCGIVAFFTGLTGIVRKKDYSILVLLSTTLGLITLLGLLAEIISPH